MEDYALIIANLQAENTALKATVAQLQAMIEELQARLAQNSANSSKPPSSDGFQKKTIKPALTKEEGRKPGGQKGHPGTTLHMVEIPDVVIQYQLTTCQHCGKDLTNTLPTLHQRRQVFDLPPPTLYVEEHRQMARQCSCGCVNVGEFPPRVAAPLQYGPRIQAQSILLNIDYKLPFAKISQFWADLTGYGYNPATLTQAQATLIHQLIPIQVHIGRQIQQAQVVHFDETGLRVAGKLHWLHRSAAAVACTDLWTYLFVHPSRGQKALQSAESLFEGCTNWLVHDCWSSYFTATTGRHALCGAHLLRELQGQIEADRLWAVGLHAYLLALYKATCQGPLPANERDCWQETYRQWCQQGLEEEPDPIIWYTVSGKVRKGRAKQTKGRNLLDRLVAHESAVLAFAFEAGVPFTNNEAERALRPAKIKQKVSGGFRSEAGAERYARIGGFIATLRKQNYNVVEQLASVLQGHFQWDT